MQGILRMSQGVSQRAIYRKLYSIPIRKQIVYSIPISKKNSRNYYEIGATGIYFNNKPAFHNLSIIYRIIT